MILYFYVLLKTRALHTTLSDDIRQLEMCSDLWSVTYAA